MKLLPPTSGKDADGLPNLCTLNGCWGSYNITVSNDTTDPIGAVTNKIKKICGGEIGGNITCNGFTINKNKVNGAYSAYVRTMDQMTPTVDPTGRIPKGTKVITLFGGSTDSPFISFIKFDERVAIEYAYSGSRDIKADESTWLNSLENCQKCPSVSAA